jgi:hypothetical protein
LFELCGAHVAFTQSVGQQNLDWRADQLLARVPKQHLRLGVDNENTTLMIHGDQGIGRRFEKCAEPRLSSGSGVCYLLKVLKRVTSTVAEVGEHERENAQ